MKSSILLMAIALLTVVACKKKDNDDDQTTTPDPYATQKTSLKTTYANLAFAMYDDALITAQDLKTALYDFVDNPSTTTHNAAKQAWLDAREVYGVTEVFRFVDGPIDNSSEGPEGLINAWPMDEAYVDYVQGSPNAGIINDPANFPTIDAATIIAANEFGSETNISTGYHAIEFLLWGQDLDAAGAGARSYTDYTTAPNYTRRGQYLKVLADILVSALQQVRDEWDPNGVSNYRSEWLNLGNDIAFRKMFNSIRALSGEELSGERMTVALDNADQEDEHSCFSDNTHRDIALNALGMKLLYTGTYTRIDGTVIDGYSISDLVAEVNATKNTDMLALFQASEDRISEMMVPFDQAIIIPAERVKVQAAIDALLEENVMILDIADDFGFTF